MKHKKLYSAVLAFSLLASFLGRMIGMSVPVKADIGYDINWEMEKKGEYQDIPNIVKTSFGKPESWVKSGIYSYEFLDAEKKYITVRNVDKVEETLKIPEEIDGYKVIGVGCWGLSAGKISDDGGWQGGEMSEELSYGKICADTDKLKEIILPEGLEFVGTGAFYSKARSTELCRIKFPHSLVYIGSYAFQNQEMLKDISLPSGAYVDVQAFPDMDNWKKIEFFSNCKIQDDNFIGNKDVVIIKKKGESNYHVPVSVIEKTQHLYFNGALKKVFLHLGGNKVEDAAGDMIPATAFIEKVYIHNKNTILSVEQFIDIGELYTVPGASAIKYAKKTKTTYHIKTTDKTKEVKAKKKSDQYQASWKKIKTIVHKYEYKAEKKKWKVTKSPVQTVYKVFGKKKKNGSYRLIKTTKKRSIQSKYKYIKVVPDKEWN